MGGYLFQIQEYGYSNKVRLTIWHQLFLEFWLVNTWFFAHWRRQRTVTRLKMYAS